MLATIALRAAYILALSVYWEAKTLLVRRDLHDRRVQDADSQSFDRTIAVTFGKSVKFRPQGYLC